MKREEPRLVYSTGVGRLCGECRRPADECRCTSDRRQSKARSSANAPRGAQGTRAGASSNPKDGVVRVGRQTQGRAGKGVTVITGLPLQGAALEQLARELKQRCGSGGTVRDGVVEIQGEHRDTLVAELAKRGYQAKRAGG